MVDNSNISCFIPDWYDPTLERLKAIGYYITPWAYLATAVIPSYVVAVAFCIKYRRVSAYVLQQIYICQLALHGTAFIVYFCFVRQWSGPRTNEKEFAIFTWFRSSFRLMWFSCHVPGPLSNIFNLATMSLLVYMALDRLVALGFPTMYRKLSHKSIAVGLTLFSYTVAVSVNISDFPRYMMVSNGSIYSCTTNYDYINLPIAKVMSTFRNGVNVLIVVCILVFDTATIVLFFYRQRKTAEKLKLNARERENKKIARALLILTISQSAILMLVQPFSIALYIIPYFYPNISSCYGAFLTAFLETYAQFLRFLQFISLFIFCKPFSDLIMQLSLMKRFLKQASSTQQS